MTISSTDRKAGPYAGNDATTSFPFSFKVFAASDMVVVRTDADGIETILSAGVDYSVTLSADQETSPGGTITLPAALASGYLLTITSGVPNLQPVDLTNQGGFYPSVINAALDRLTIMVQQVAEKAGRSIAVNISSGEDPATLVNSLFAAEANAIAQAGAAGASASAAANSASAAANSAGLFWTSETGSTRLAAGTTAQRDASPSQGYFRFNTTVSRFEGFNGLSWGAVGGATGGGSDAAFYENDTTITADYTITTGKNAGSFGPVSIANGVTVTVPNGSVWSVI